MAYLDNLRMEYGGSVKLHKVHTKEYKCNMDTNKLVVVEFLNKDEVTCCDEYFYHTLIRACYNILITACHLILIQEFYHNQFVCVHITLILLCMNLM